MTIEPLSSSRQETRNPLARLSVIPFFVSLLFFGLGVQEWRFKAGSQIVQGIALSKWISRSSRSTSNFVQYRFTTREGQRLEGKDSVLPKTWRAIREGGPVAVEYIPGSPDTNRVAGQTGPVSFYLVIGMGCVLLGIVLLFK